MCGNIWQDWDRFGKISPMTWFNRWGEFYEIWKDSERYGEIRRDLGRYWGISQSSPSTQDLGNLAMIWQDPTIGEIWRYLENWTTFGKIWQSARYARIWQDSKNWQNFEVARFDMGICGKIRLRFDMIRRDLAKIDWVWRNLARFDKILQYWVRVG